MFRAKLNESTGYEYPNISNPTTFFDLYAIARVHSNKCLMDIIKGQVDPHDMMDCDHIFDCMNFSNEKIVSRKIRFNGDEYQRHFECDVQYYYKHLISPETAFLFLDSDIKKKFYVAAVFFSSVFSKQTRRFKIPQSNERFESIAKEVVNVPMEKNFSFSPVNLKDLNLYCEQAASAYEFFFGDYEFFTSKYHEDSMSVTIKLVDEKAVVPTKTRRSDTGLDITIIKKVKTDQWGNEWYDTGIQVKPPIGYYTELHGRSSLIKLGWQLANNVGIIDETYRNNLLCVFTRLHPDAPSLETLLPLKACQLVLRENIMAHSVVVDDLGDTDRGMGGFGSTGN